MPRINWSADMGPEWDLKRFRRRVRQLHKQFPCEYRIAVKLVVGADIRDDDGNACHAITIAHPNSWEIQVLRLPDISLSIRLLVEEYSHCLAPPNRKTHHNKYRDIHHKILYTILGD